MNARVTHVRMAVDVWTESTLTRVTVSPGILEPTVKQVSDFIESVT